MAIIGKSQIERIEVCKRAVSVLYGSEAIGGVVNIITKKGETSLLEEVLTSVMIQLQMDSGR